MMQHFNRLKQRLQTFLECNKGVIFIEFAICVSVLLVMFFGAMEISRYALIIQKAEKTVSTVTDIVTQTQNPVPGIATAPPVSTMAILMTLVPDLMSPYSSPNMLVIISDVSIKTAGSPILNWQYCGGGTLSAKSKIKGSPGGTADISAALPGFTMAAPEEIIVSEMFYSFIPITNSNIIPSSMLYRNTVSPPRNSSDSLAAPATYPPCP